MKKIIAGTSALMMCCLWSGVHANQISATTQRDGGYSKETIAHFGNLEWEVDNQKGSTDAEFSIYSYANGGQPIKSAFRVTIPRGDILDGGFKADKNLQYMVRIIPVQPSATTATAILKNT